MGAGSPQSLAFVALTPDIIPPASPQNRGCGVCRGCQTQEDCGHCRICLRFPRPGLKRQWRCLQRRCFWVSQAEGTGDGGAKARPELTLLLNSSPALLLLPASLAFPASCLIFFSAPCSSPWFCPPAFLCQHLAHRFRGHPQGCQQRPPHVVVPPTVSALLHTA